MQTGSPSEVHPYHRSAISPSDMDGMIERYGYTSKIRVIIESENLLPPGLLGRLHAAYAQHSGLMDTRPFLFNGPDRYEGLDGFRQVLATLERNNIHLGHILERELFVEVYRFKASRHLLNTIDWDRYEEDPMFQLVFPQPGMMRPETVEAYRRAATAQERREFARDYIRQTNPHDGNQLLNKSCFTNDDGSTEVVEGSQHKYPQCQLIFDKTTQTCFSFCTYCFRHAQVRGDEDMFIQEDIPQVHAYLRKHPEVTDLLITGGDAGYLPADRFRQYVAPLIEDPELRHIGTVRIGSRMLTFEPERILSSRYEAMLMLFSRLHDHGIQVSWMGHFSTPRELLNPSTIAAIRRLQNHGVVIRSQSPIMNHISLFTRPDGQVDIERSAQNWIDLGNLLGALLIRFHSIYCARATGEHHYFAAPLADIDRVFSRIYRSLSSLNRPSRYITMTTSAGKLSILGTAEIDGRKAFALKFNESRNMEWMDRVFLAAFDEKESRVDFLTPFEPGQFFYENELREIENALRSVHKRG